MNNKTRNIAIVGAGPVGCLLAIYLLKRNYQITLIEKRKDFREHISTDGRSINIALSNRGIAALKEINMDERALQHAVPMFGRMMHDKNGDLTAQPYGISEQHINSIDRNVMNLFLLEEAIYLGAVALFEHQCIKVDSASNEITLDYAGHLYNLPFDFIIGADGAHSAVRNALMGTDDFFQSVRVLHYGYKELHLPPNGNRFSSLDKNYLHIWPRKSFMLIALPNYDGSFTCTLFLPTHGETSFDCLDDEESIKNFFSENFSDAMQRMPSLVEDFKQNPTGILEMVDCYPWSIKKILLIGDAAHAIFPFYGQGMNAGFEDCRVLNRLLNKHNDDWEAAIEEFIVLRKPDADAIAQLSENNFEEMREHVADKKFIIRRKIEARLHEQFPDQWIPLYSMVTFHEEIRYSTAIMRAEKQKVIMDEVMKNLRDIIDWENLDFKSIADRVTKNVIQEVPSNGSYIPHSAPLHHAHN